MSSAFFRANVGACIINEQGEILSCKRRNASDGAWQMPQGGIDADEAPEAALWREVQEEVGLDGTSLTLLQAHPEWIAYELPDAFKRPKTGLGQVQKWFLLRAASAAPVRVDGEEFDQWRWLPPQELLAVTVAFRQPVYRRLFADFGLLP